MSKFVYSAAAECGGIRLSMDAESVFVPATARIMVNGGANLTFGEVVSWVNRPIRAYIAASVIKDIEGVVSLVRLDEIKTRADEGHNVAAGPHTS